jgi:putative hydrolase of HD superfamily
MALLHDFAEARLTDIPNPAKLLFPDGAIAAAESRVVGDQWPDDEEARELLAEFLAGETEEAKLVAAADHLELVFQAVAYREAGHRLAERMLERARGGPAVRHPLTRPYAEALLRDAE